MDEKLYHVDFEWDPAAEVWVATSDEIPGLVLSDRSEDVLIRKIQSVAPSLLVANTGRCEEGRIKVRKATPGDHPLTLQSAA